MLKKKLMFSNIILNKFLNGMKNFVENHVLYVKVDYAAAYFIEFVVKQLVYYRDEAVIVFKKILYQKL